MNEQQLVLRYRANYGLSAAINARHVAQHRQIEEELTKRLWNSTPENRWDVFDDCYTLLYKSLPWLNESVGPSRWARTDPWPRLLKKRSTILEVGSGGGELIRRLATLGHRCVATEITVERGEKHVTDVAGLEWKSTDGVNLAKFEQQETYDVVISSQVIEHFHPDDVAIHFQNVRSILKPGGEYIFDTPHVGTGPHDLSRVFDLDRPAFMHLREYDFRTLASIARTAGFRKVRAILCPTPNIGPIKSRLLFRYYSLIDYVFSKAGVSHRVERSLRRVLRFALVPGNIWLAVEK